MIVLSLYVGMLLLIILLIIGVVIAEDYLSIKNKVKSFKSSQKPISLNEDQEKVDLNEKVLTPINNIIEQDCNLHCEYITVKDDELISPPIAVPSVQWEEQPADNDDLAESPEESSYIIKMCEEQKQREKDKESIIKIMNQFYS